MTHLFSAFLRRALLCAGICLGASQLIFAQTTATSYTFSRLSTAYTPIVPDSVVGTATTNDVTFNITTKFPLRFLDTVVDIVRLNPNGALSFGLTNNFLAGAGTGFINGGTPNGMILRSREGINRMVAAAFNVDLQAQVNAQIGIKWNLTAAPGQRSLLLEFKNYKRQGFRFRGDSINFQIELRENGQIAYRYGQMQLVPSFTSIPVGVQIGLRGRGPSDVLALTGAWSGPNVGTSNRDSLLIAPTVMPMPGETYLFTPPALADGNLAALRVFAIGNNTTVLNCDPSNPNTIGVLVYNAGGQPQSSATVGYAVNNGGAAATQVVTFSPALQPYQSALVQFSGNQAFTPPSAGRFTLRGFVRLAGDPIIRNDTARGTTVIRGPVSAVLNRPAADIPQARRLGWRQGQGLASPTNDSVNFYQSGGAVGFGPTISTYVNQGRDYQPQWYFLASQVAGGNLTMRFRLGVTLNFSGNLATEVYDDTLKVVVSTNCGQTWRTVARFDQRDVAAQRITNAPATFEVPVINGPGTFSVAFLYVNNGTVSPVNYRWHFDDMAFIAQNDATAESIALGAQRFPGCAFSSQEPLTLTFRNTGITPISQISAGYIVNGQASAVLPFSFPLPVAPGGTSRLTFSGVNGVNLSVPGLYSVKAFTRLLQDGSSVNDTASIAFNTAAATPIPGLPRVTDQAGARATGWRLGSQNPISVDTSLYWRGAFLTNNNAMGLFVDVNTAATDMNEWFYRSGLRNTGQVGISFKLAVSSNWGLPLTRPAASTLGDDTLSLVVSRDCGATWNTVARFSAASLTAGIINDTLKPFAYTLATAPGSLQVAFRFTSNGTRAPLQYRYLLDDISFVSSNDAQVSRVTVPALRFTGCNLPAQAQVDVTVRNAGSEPISQTVVGYQVDNQPFVSQQVSFSPPLAPGLSTLVSLSGAQGANLSSINGPVSIKGIVNLVGGDGNRANDTLMRSYVAGASAATVIQDDTVIGLLDARRSNWRMAQGQPISLDTNYIWRSQNIGALGGDVITASVADSIRNRTTWFYRTGLATQGPLSVGFSAALIRVQTNGVRVRDIATDTLEFLVSKDCGETWDVIRRFTQTDVAGGVIDSTMRTFGGLLVSEAGNFTMGFRLRVGNRVDVPYRWAVDNITISGRKDVALEAISSPSSPATQWCLNRPVPIDLIVVNNAIQQIDSITVAYRVNGGAIQTRKLEINLGAASRRVVSITPSQTLRTATGTVNLWVQISTSGEATDDTSDNTRNVSYTAVGQRSLPQGPMISPVFFSTNGWSQQRADLAGTATTTNAWITGRAYPVSTMAAQIFPTGNVVDRRILLSPSFVPSRGTVVRFEASVSSTTASIGTVSSIGDDSLRVMYRANCGPWQTLLSLTEADLQAQRLSTNLRQFVVGVPVGPTDTVQVAFVATNAGTDQALSYAWNVTRVELTDVTAVRSLEQALLQLVPNPAHGQVQVLVGGKPAAGTVRVLNLEGKVVATEALNDGTGTLNLNNLPKGMYLVEVVQGNQRARQRLVVQ